MQIKPSGRPKNIPRYELILSLRQKRKSITEIAKAIGIRKQGVAYYLKKYGDVELSTVQALDN
jgi:predicted transcriptional regulator